MDRFWKIAPWISRFFLLPPIALFLRIGTANLLNPSGSLGERGIAFTSGFGLTTGRIAFGALPLACALFMASCLLSERRLLSGLSFLAILDTVILVSRSVAMVADGSVKGNLPLVYAEVGLIVTTTAGILLELRRRARTRAGAGSDSTAGQAPLHRQGPALDIRAGSGGTR